MRYARLTAEGISEAAADIEDAAITVLESLRSHLCCARRDAYCAMEREPGSAQWPDNSEVAA